MTFKVVTTSILRFEDGEKISDIYPIIKSFDYVDDIEYFDFSYQSIKEPYKYIGKINLTTIKQVVEIMRLLECELVITGTPDEPIIEIYDSYRE
jgi:hypothetical protein